MAWNGNALQSEGKAQFSVAAYRNAKERQGKAKLGGAMYCKGRAKFGGAMYCKGKAA